MNDSTQGITGKAHTRKAHAKGSERWIGLNCGNANEKIKRLRLLPNVGKNQKKSNVKWKRSKR
jgi:hypothetical protein